MDETCTKASRASCNKCLKNHGKHADKFILIEEVEEFIKGLNGLKAGPEIEKFREFKKNIVDALNRIEDVII